MYVIILTPITYWLVLLWFNNNQKNSQFFFKKTFQIISTYELPISFKSWVYVVRIMTLKTHILTWFVMIFSTSSIQNRYLQCKSGLHTNNCWHDNNVNKLYIPLDSKKAIGISNAKVVCIPIIVDMTTMSRNLLLIWYQNRLNRQSIQNLS